MSSEPSWIEKLSELRARREPCAMVVVTGVAGSGPREAGARMIVTARGPVWGTIGGGNLELQATRHAQEALSAGEPRSESVDYPLSEKVGQCCGGKVTLFYETFPWRPRRIAIFGAGHVGQALAGLAPWLSAEVLLIDGRQENEIHPPLPAERPYELLCVDAPEEEVEHLGPNALVLIMTHSHALDLEILRRTLLHGGFAYVGLIGSERKWQRFRTRLEQRGLSPDLINSVRCPIGVTKGAKEPTAIALSVAAELTSVLNPV